MKPINIYSNPESEKLTSEIDNDLKDLGIEMDIKILPADEGYIMWYVSQLMKKSKAYMLVLLSFTFLAACSDDVKVIEGPKSKLNNKNAETLDGLAKNGQELGAVAEKKKAEDRLAEFLNNLEKSNSRDLALEGEIVFNKDSLSNQNDTFMIVRGGDIDFESLHELAKNNRDYIKVDTTNSTITLLSGPNASLSGWIFAGASFKLASHESIVTQGLDLGVFADAVTLDGVISTSPSFVGTIKSAGDLVIKSIILNQSSNSQIKAKPAMPVVINSQELLKQISGSDDQLASIRSALNAEVKEVVSQLRNDVVEEEYRTEEYWKDGSELSRDQMNKYSNAFIKAVASGKLSTIPRLTEMVNDDLANIRKFLSTRGGNPAETNDHLITIWSEHIIASLNRKDYLASDLPEESKYRRLELWNHPGRHRRDIFSFVQQARKPNYGSDPNSTQVAYRIVHRYLRSGFKNSNGFSVSVNSNSEYQIISVPVDPIRVDDTKITPQKASVVLQSKVVRGESPKVDLSNLEEQKLPLIDLGLLYSPENSRFTLPAKKVLTLDIKHTSSQYRESIDEENAPEAEQLKYQIKLEPRVGGTSRFYTNSLDGAQKTTPKADLLSALSRIIEGQQITQLDRTLVVTFKSETASRELKILREAILPRRSTMQTYQELEIVK